MAGRDVAQVQELGAGFGAELGAGRRNRVTLTQAVLLTEGATDQPETVDEPSWVDGVRLDLDPKIDHVFHGVHTSPPQAATNDSTDKE